MPKQNISTDASQDYLDLTSEDLPSGPTYVVGVAIFQLSKESNGLLQRRVLVVKRTAHEDQFPNMWELPGGHVEKGETIPQAVSRETYEETGLVVDNVVGGFEELRWTSCSSGRESVQYNYAVTVKSPFEIKLSPDEHSEWKWADDVEVTSLPCSEAMRKVFADSFKYDTQKGT